MVISVWIPGEPKGQPRPRAFARGGSARVYDPGTAEGWKGLVAAALRPHLGDPLLGPVRVTMRFLMPRPGRLHRKGPHPEDGEIPHVGKPDVDNLAKAVLDVGTQLHLWHDDAQVARLVVEKSYHADKGGRPGLHFTIESLTEGDLDETPQASRDRT